MYEIGTLAELVGDSFIGDELVGEDDFDDNDLAALLGAAARRSPAANRMRQLQQRAKATAMAVRNVEQGTILKERQPTKSREFPVGFDSVTAIAPGASATLTQRPQIIFRPERIVIPASVAAFFQILDIKVGKNSQFVSAGALPAATFSESAFGVRLKMDTVQISQDLILFVQNIDVAGHRFLASMIGEAVE